MPEYLIESLQDPRLDFYRNLKHVEPRDRDLFVAEGDKLVLRLFESPCRALSMLCTAPTAQRLAAFIPHDIPVFITTSSVISKLVGYKFHRGVLAVGVPPAELTLQSILAYDVAPLGTSLILACPEIRDPGNLGTMIRTAAAFGATCVVAGRMGTSPFSRRVLRTSMGTVLKLPIVQTDYWECALDTLHQNDFETIAAVVDSSAPALAEMPRLPRVAVLMGNEHCGLPPDLVPHCRRRVQIPMSNQAASLNVAVAAGIILHHFARG